MPQPRDTKQTDTALRSQKLHIRRRLPRSEPPPHMFKLSIIRSEKIWNLYNKTFVTVNPYRRTNKRCTFDTIIK